MSLIQKGDLVIVQLRDCPGIRIVGLLESLDPRGCVELKSAVRFVVDERNFLHHEPALGCEGLLPVFVDSEVPEWEYIACGVLSISKTFSQFAKDRYSEFIAEHQPLPTIEG